MSHRSWGIYSKRHALAVSRNAERNQKPAKDLPEDIQASLSAVKKFISQCMVTKCHFCESNITEKFSPAHRLTQWRNATSEKSRADSLPLSAVECPNCTTFTCLACGKETFKIKSRQVGDYQLSSCCADGRVFSLWILLAKFDQAMLIVSSREQSSSDSKGNRRQTYSKGDTQDSRGIGYADDGGMYNYDFLSSQPLDFKASDEKTDGGARMIFRLATELIPAPTITNLPAELRGMLQVSLIVDKAAELLRNDCLEEVTKRASLYRAVLNFVDRLGEHPELIALVQESRYHKQQTAGLQALTQGPVGGAGGQGSMLMLGEKIPSVDERLKNLAKQSEVLLTAPEADDLNNRSSQVMMQLCVEITSIYNDIASKKPSKAKASTSPEEKWSDFHRDNCLTRDDAVLDELFYRIQQRAEGMAHLRTIPGRMRRLASELASMATSLPLGIFVQVSETRPDVMKCLIMGPPDSPYGYGLFAFDIVCPETYPNVPPFVLCPTVTYVQNKISPNLHPDGKVCLSLLGTWREGDAAAQWQPGKSTILSVLVSIQAMIFCEDPFRNEPVFTGATGRHVDREARDYILKVQPLTIRLGMLDWLTRPDLRNGVWKDVVRAHFTFNRAKILSHVEKWASDNRLIRHFPGIHYERGFGTGANLEQQLVEKLNKL
ncbi:hypothetical protein AJ80_08904 [Polytolypa hystricis UAMH7299]|uniref:UBC core domain-containing protein n=1 Tax=Polytolypa hystricis (strain UAMH7299) TaxID=1447883 RepID=A0A2B7X065_POLH7|nr:hypothetical protein AJ80_08904 [Polytolypa hystricis UAMH7299]